MDEQSKEIALQRILGVIGTCGCFFIYYQFSSGIWINPWDLLPSWLMEFYLIGFVFGWLFSMFYFSLIYMLSPLFVLIGIISLFPKKITMNNLQINFIKT